MPEVSFTRVNEEKNIPLNTHAALPTSEAETFIALAGSPHGIYALTADGKVYRYEPPRHRKPTPDNPHPQDLACPTCGGNVPQDTQQARWVPLTRYRLRFLKTQA